MEGAVLPEGYDYDTHSRLAGPLTEPPADQPYRVRYTSLLAREPHRLRAVAMMALAPLLTGLLLVYLVWPTHWVERDESQTWLAVLDIAMLAGIGLIEFFMVVNVFSVAHATMVARDPVPVTPEPGTRVAFITTYVPGKEPLSMLRATLEGATRITHDGRVDVWLLDEGDDQEAKDLCRELGVRHFSRKGVDRWNLPAGPHKAKTKHGNYNAWLDAHGDEYDFFASVDTDHIPLPNFLERMTGYFRDPDVAFVVGPQVYGNYTNPVTKAAESQQYLFHALIQRAGNRYRAPMFVGTNNVVRISAVKQIGGLYDSITEDMATGFELHRTRNPLTRRRWRSVYTPDVLAVGEGPTSWTDFFTQQMRWSRGTYETLFKQFWKAPFTMPYGRLFQYSLMVCYYPMTAVNWFLGIFSCVLFMWFGASGTSVSTSVWLMLYSDAAALQIGLYLWNRRHNVSPHEPKGSGGLAGMAMSAISAPIYLKSFTAALLRRPCRFVVTPKGGDSSADRLLTFRVHLFWAVVLVASLTASQVLGNTHAAMRTWAVLALAIALSPVAIWRYTVAAEARRRKAAAAAGAPVAVPVTLPDAAAVTAADVTAVPSAQDADPAPERVRAGTGVEREPAAVDAEAPGRTPEPGRTSGPATGPVREPGPLPVPELVPVPVPEPVPVPVPLGVPAPSPVAVPAGASGKEEVPVLAPLAPESVPPVDVRPAQHPVQPLQPVLPAMYPVPALHAAAPPVHTLWGELPDGHQAGQHERPPRPAFVSGAPAAAVDPTPPAGSAVATAAAVVAATTTSRTPLTGGAKDGKPTMI
ncbi:cellulose synthase/poly-beta-1,6-N-acetylglucosamine synthase-like glycosyltransferase [Streptomyces sp. MJP52]|nr:cellulose synthase/poly-beta-1,6-N-acetylglucosamine synthase-like glycosyltransferase [Streptomyces sp. MJP52]